MKKDPLYYLSLPERFIRSSAAAATGVVHLVTKLTLPKLIKESSTYRVTFGMLLQFLTQKVAQVEQSEAEYEVGKDYLAKKTAGMFVEGVGLLSFHFSPMWLLVILSDLTGGSKEYLLRLMKELKQQGIIRQDEEYSNVFDLLEGINTSANIGANAIDMPPLSAKELREFKDQLSESINGNVEHTTRIMKDLEEVWKKMNQTGKSLNLSVTKLNGAMTLDLIQKSYHSVKKGIGTSKATGKITVELIDEFILSSYKESIREVNEKGKMQYMKEHMQPFMKQFHKHYDENHKTLTEKILSEKVFSKK
ncbi:MAG: hypothetical protein JW708_04860 [Vallitaleaceae bacterium]|nr:hypothetical protein [Vallitaleaceae bacterium]